MTFKILVDDLNNSVLTTTVDVDKSKLIYKHSDKEIYKANQDKLDVLFAKYARDHGWAYLKPVFNEAGER